MAHIISEIPSNPIEVEFMDMMQHADDFFKIELLRQAKNWYTKALSLNMETEKVKHQIAECDRLLKYENKIVKIVIAIAVVLVVVAYFMA
jgi:hypothetical protein